MSKTPILIALSLALGTSALALADDPAPQPSPLPNATRVDISASYIPIGTSAVGASQGGDAALNIRHAVTPGGTDIEVNLHGGYAGLEGLGGGSLGFAPNRESGKGGLIGQTGADCNVVTCTFGTWVGGRIALGDGQTLDIQGRVPVVGTFYVNRETGDQSATLGGARLGFNKQFSGLGRISAFIQAEATDPLSFQTSNGAQKGVGGVFEAGFSADAPVSDHVALTAAVDAQDQVFKHVDSGGQSTNKNDVGVTGSAGVKVAF